MPSLSRDEAAHYWESRHIKTPGLRSGGHIGLAEEANEAFYVVRLAVLVRLLGTYHEPAAPLRLLDAGCGKGYFSDSLARMGHHVTGIDASAAAIEECRANRFGTYRVERLEELSWSTPFDIVYSIDVLFHILDEEAWLASLRAIAKSVRVGGMLVVTDIVTSIAGPRSDYIVGREVVRYDGVLRDLGFMRAVPPLPYEFGDNPNGFFVFRRMD